MRTVLAVVFALLALLAAAPALAENSRYKTCVVDLVDKCQREVVVGEMLKLRLVDSDKFRTPYSVCVKETGDRQCFDGRTGRRGRTDRILYVPGFAGSAVARWRVNGKQVGVTQFQVLATSAPPAP